MEQTIMPGKYQAVPRVLCFVTHGDEVLLLRGAPDKRIWPDKYNGVGGHVETGEDILSGARREIYEETGLTVDHLLLRGVINIQTSAPQIGILLFVFTASARTREVRPSPEGRLEWVPKTRVGELPVVEDVPLLLRRALEAGAGSEPFFASYAYDAQGQLDVTFAE
jgi:8-oxo-dGTP diphosphatase